MLLARGTTAQRPGTPVTGMFRYNTTTNAIEYYDNDSWEGVSSSFTLATSQTFNGDGSTTAFTLATLSGSDSYTVAGVLVMLNGVVQEPTTVYGISGVTMTFTSAPASGDLIEVRKFTTTTTVLTITDSDGDTQIQTEESSDEDKIRMDTGGTERVVIDANGIDLKTGTFQGTATTATNVTVADESSDTTCFPTFVTGATGDLPPKTGTNLTFNSSSGVLTATGFAGALTGDVTGTADVATAVTVADESSDTACNVLFVTAATGDLAPKSGTNLTFDSANGNLTTTTFTGIATSAKYADLAEMYAADEEVAPGTVVHFAGEGKLAECDVANCRAVAGIVSTDPAHLMNSAQEGVALALAGRVPCKVTGPVAAGDLMVSAGNGMAMANNEAAMGTVIGKAIEANEGGEGVIEVLALMM